MYILCSFLRELSDQLAANWVPVVAVQGSPSRPAELRHAAAAAGCANLAALLWLQSLREAFHMQPCEPDAQLPLVSIDRSSWVESWRVTPAKINGLPQGGESS